MPIKKDDEIKNTPKEEVQEEKETPKGITVREMKKIAQTNTPIN